MIIGKDGVEKIEQIDLDDNEKKQLDVGKVVDVTYSENDKGYIASAINIQNNDRKKDLAEEYDSYEVIKNISKSQ